MWVPVKQAARILGLPEPLVYHWSLKGRFVARVDADGQITHLDLPDPTPATDVEESAFDLEEIRQWFEQSGRLSLVDAGQLSLLSESGED